MIKTVINLIEVSRWSTIVFYAKEDGSAARIDVALHVVEKNSLLLNRALSDNYFSRNGIEFVKLVALIDIIKAIAGFKEYVVGRVYDSLLVQFAISHTNRTRKCSLTFNVNLIAEMLEPSKGQVYYPVMNSRWIDFNFGKYSTNSFTKDLRASNVIAKSSFHMKEWWDGKLEGDPRWDHADPPNGNANFGWLQQILYHRGLHPQTVCISEDTHHFPRAHPISDATPGNDSMALLLANGSMSSNTEGEGEIRSGVVKADLVECMVALPGQLFTNTQIPACIWFLTKTNQKRGRGAAAFLDRTGEVLFINARKLGYMVDRVLLAFTDEDTNKIASTFYASKRNKLAYEDIPGFCKSATLNQAA